MKNVTLTVNKAYVYDEVAKTTSYAGAKMMAEDVNAYDRIFTTDEDRLLLERFWLEVADAVTGNLMPFIKGVPNNPINHGVGLWENYEAVLELPSSYDDNLTKSIETALYNFFVLSIVGRWYMVTNKAEAEAVALQAAGVMTDIMQKIYYKKKPTRIPVNE